MKIVFPYLAQPHQVPHSLPIALELARLRPDFEIHTACATPAQQAFVRAQAALHGPGLRLRHELLDPPWYDRLRLHAGFGSVAWKRALLRRHRPYFAGFDAVVTPERSSLYLRQLDLPGTRLIWTRHGAGDREIGFADDVRDFDFVLMAGAKIEERLLAAGLIRPGHYATGIYAKFDWIGDLGQRPPLFDNGRPTVLYNPHFRPALSSWPRLGPAVLDRFAASSRYNLIFAPHIRLFDPPTRRQLRQFERWRGLPHVHLDLGSERSIDMSYTAVADLYLGDVSSQVAEYLYRPRPCAFLNAHRVEWQNDPNYRFWTLGPVADTADALETLIDQAFENHVNRIDAQRDYFRTSFGLAPGTPSAARGAEAISRYLTRHAPPSPH
jgi:hypothetical protein